MDMYVFFPIRPASLFDIDSMNCEVLPEIVAPHAQASTAEDSYFYRFEGPEASSMPNPLMYHDEELHGGIRAELLRDVGTVLKSPYLAYNWFGRVSTTLSPWHTSADV